jgi:hypothetical protein
MHGGLSTGPRTVAGLARLRAARTQHGGRSREVRQLLRCMAALLRGAAAPEEGAVRGREKRRTTERSEVPLQGHAHRKGGADA